MTRPLERLVSRHRRYKGDMMILTGKQIGALAEFVGYEMMQVRAKAEEETVEAEITLGEKDGKTLAWFRDYPEEGCIDLSDF